MPAKNFKHCNIKLFTSLKVCANFLRKYYPWPNDDECKDFKIDFHVNESSSLIALASFPASGSTWLRYMIEGMAGVFTGSFMTHRWSTLTRGKNGKNIAII